jgi:hypothetical protein
MERRNVPIMQRRNVAIGITYVLVEIMGEKEFCKFIQILVDEANDTLPPAVRSLFEKIMYPFCSVNKKRYAYIGFKRTEIKYMGKQRRSAAPRTY